MPPRRVPPHVRVAEQSDIVHSLGEEVDGLTTILLKGWFRFSQKLTDKLGSHFLTYVHPDEHAVGTASRFRVIDDYTAFELWF